MKMCKNLRTKYIVILWLIFVVFDLKGQEVNDFKPYGKPVFLTFTNIHYSVNKDGGNPAFELTRLYLGYEYFFSNTISARANIDIGDPGIGGLQMTAYVKNAFIQYRNKKFAGRLGMIGTDAYNLIEKQWGYRYIYKTLQDEHGFNPSADLGTSVEFVPAKFLSFDISVLNGEGYKRVQSDSVLKYTAGVTIRPVKGLQLRGYTDFMKKEHLQNTISLFAGYSFKDFRFGFEYSLQKNNKMVNGHDFSGISAFASLRLAEKVSVFGRYDKLLSEKVFAVESPWNHDNDGQLFMAGFEYSPVSGIRVAPVFTGWLPDINSDPFKATPGLHFEIKL